MPTGPRRLPTSAGWPSSVGALAAVLGAPHERGQRDARGEAEQPPTRPTSSMRASPVSRHIRTATQPKMQHRLQLVHQEVEQVAERRGDLAQARELAVGAVEHEREFEHERRGDEPRPAGQQREHRAGAGGDQRRRERHLVRRDPRVAQRVDDDGRRRARDPLGEPVDVVFLLRRPIDGGDLGCHGRGLWHARRCRAPASAGNLRRGVPPGRRDLFSRDAARSR